MTRTATTLVAMLLGVWFSALALAQSPPQRSPLGLPLPPSAEQAQSNPGKAEPPGAMARAWNWILSTQQKLNRDMAQAVRDIKSGGSTYAAAVLAFIGFMYGVLHAAGPGHGKAIISSYVLANERTVRRGIFLSFLAALFQALSAIAIVGVLAIALNATSLTIKSTENWIETISWALVALIGAWMLTGEVRKLLARRPAPQPAGAAVVEVYHYENGRRHVQKLELNAPHRHGDHDCCDHHHVSHGHDDCCGHEHMPSPKDLEGDLSWGKALAIAGSIGIRPCTGAILVLIFSLSQGMLWAGILATFAMAIGTAITTSALAALAVGSKELARRYAGEGSRMGEHIGTAAGLAGSTLVLLMGGAFFMASLSQQSPL